MCFFILILALNLLSSSLARILCYYFFLVERNNNHSCAECLYSTLSTSCFSRKYAKKILRSKVATNYFFAPLHPGVKLFTISQNSISRKNKKRKNQETKLCFFAPLHLGVKSFVISQNLTHPVMDFYPLW